MCEPDLVPIAESVVRRIANIMGESSAAAQALAEFERRQAAGEDVALFRLPSMMLVGPADPRPRGASGEGIIL